MVRQVYRLEGAVYAVLYSRMADLIYTPFYLREAVATTRYSEVKEDSFTILTLLIITS